MAFHWPRHRVPRARPGYSHSRSSRAASGRRTGLRPWAQLLEDRTVLSAFYDLTTLASTAGGVFTSFGDLPSINDQGVVAFVGNTNSGNGIWTAGLSGTLTDVTATFAANNDGRTYGRGVAINDSGQIIARDQINSEFYVREWNADQPNQHTDLFKHPATGINSPDAQFASAQTFTATDNTGDAAFVLYDPAVVSRDLVEEAGNNLGDGTYTSIANFDATGSVSPRPQMTSAGQVLYLSQAGQLVLAGPGGNRQIIAGPSTGYLEIGSNAGISRDGRVIVFTAEHGYGPSLWAAMQLGSTYQIIPLAGGSPDIDSFTSFDTDSDIVVNSTWDTNRSVTVAFQGTSALGAGIYSLQLSVFGQHAYDPNPVQPTSYAEGAGGYYESGIRPVALQGDKFSAGVTIKSVQLGQGINDLERGQIAFWAQTSDGNQEIIRADPQQVIWLNFNPPADPPAGTTQANLSLLTELGITKWGWDGPMSDALKDLGVKYDPATVQNAVVAEVQKMYTDAKARVVVLGKTTDTPPAYVPEPIYGTPAKAGAFQTVFVGEGSPNGSKWLGLASQPPAAAGTIDFYDQIPDDTAVVLVNNILLDSAYNTTNQNGNSQSTPPSALSLGQVENGIATIVAHESGHNLGLFHLSEADNNVVLLTNQIMINGTLPGSFNAPGVFGGAAYPVFQYNDDLEGVSEDSAQRLQYTTGTLSADPPDPAGDLPEPELLHVVDNGTFRANIGFNAANTVAVKDLVVGLQSSVAETAPVFQDLGGGDLATLLNNANISVGADDSLIVIGSTHGQNPDIIGVAQGQEGAQNSFSPTELGLITDSALDAPVSGSGAGLHFYKQTPTGSQDLGTAAIQLSPLAATALPTLTASDPSPKAGEPLTFTATVASSVSGGAAPTGTVRFEVDGIGVGTAVTLVNGAATSGSIKLTPGTHAITAVYSGDSTYARTPGFLTATAAAPVPTVALSAGSSTLIAGQALTVMTLVTPPGPGDPTPTGSVQFAVDGSAVGAPVALAAGAASSAAFTLTAGSHTITAAYLGDATYAGATTLLTVTAAFPTATVELTASSPVVFADQSVTFNAKIGSSISGAPTAGGTVQFEVDGTDLGAPVNLTGGAATSGSVALVAGSHTITAVYSGDSTYAGVPGSLSLTAAAPSSAAAGSLDQTFGSAGLATVSQAGQTAIAIDPEGRILATGQSVVGSLLTLARYTTDGQPDVSFGNLGVSPYQPYGDGTQIAFEPDGKILVRLGDGTLVRFYSNGVVDATFGNDGVVQPPTLPDNGNTDHFHTASGEYGPLGFATLADGRIVLAGQIDHTTSAHNDVTDGYALVMYLPDGQLDTSFNGTGSVVVNTPLAVVQGIGVSNNKLVALIFGGFGDGQFELSAFNFDGTPATSFGVNGATAPVTVGYYSPTMAVQPDGKILVSFPNATQSLNSVDELLYRYNADGTLDKTFGADGVATVASGIDPTSGLMTFAIEPNGKIVVNLSGNPELLMVNSNGSVDTSFGTNGIQPLAGLGNVTVSGIAVEPSGQIVVVTNYNQLAGIVGDPVVAFGDASSVSTSSGTPTAVYDVSETAGTATITLTRGGDLSQTISVPFSTDDSGGHGGVNYTPVKTTVTFAEGMATATVAIPILNDPKASPAVDIPLRLGTPSGGAVLGSVPVGDLHIVSVEGISITPAQLPSLMQGGSGSSFTVVLQSVPTANVTVPLSISTTSPGGVLSATSLVFTPANALEPQTVTVTAASGPASSPALATVSAGPASSADPKYNGLAGGTTSVEVYPGGTATAGSIEFSAATYTVDEHAASATITFVRLGGSQGSVSAHFATSDGSAFAAGKYTPLTGSISFGPGVTSRTVTIHLIDPGRNLEGDQTVDLTLTNPTGGAALGVYPTATLTLMDTAQLAAGDLDPAFGALGVAMLSPSPGDSVAVIAVDPDGKILAAGTDSNGVVLWRTNALGQLDTSFGQQGSTSIAASNFTRPVGIAIAPDGKIVVAGSVAGQIALVRFNADGSVDTSFGTAGLETTSVSSGSDSPRAVTIESDDSILVAASIGSESGGSETGFVHFGPDGSLDIGFGDGGVLTIANVGGPNSVLEQPDGKWLILSGGGLNSSGDVTRLNPDFSIDQTFGDQGTASLDYGEFYFTLTLQPDGKILIGGGEGPGGNGQATVGRLNADGSLDTTFGSGGSVFTSFSNNDSTFQSVFIEPDGKIVAVGATVEAGGANPFTSYTAVARYLADGAPDPSFGNDGILQFSLSTNNVDTPGIAALLPGGDIVIPIESEQYPLMAALLPAPPIAAAAPGQQPGELVLATQAATVVAGSSAVFTVDRFGGSDGTVSVSYSTVDNTAVAGTDYTATSGTLTFAPGITSQTVSIPTLVDPNASGSLSLDLVLQTPTGGATLGLTDIAALTITPAPPPSTPTTLTVMPVTGTYGATAIFTAALTAAGAPLAGEPITFTVTAGGRTTTLGTATTDARGVASLGGVSLGSLAAGTYPGAVSASFGGDSSDAASTGSGDLSIAKAMPTVTWAMPAEITQGQALGAAQLDATASVPGTFAYSPPAGTVLPAGMGQTLTAVFTPADATDYKSANVSTTLDVLPTPTPTPTPTTPTPTPTTPTPTPTPTTPTPTPTTPTPTPTPTTPTSTPTTTPTPTPTPTSPIVTLASIQGEKIKLGTGRKAKKATVVVLQFSGSLNPSTAQNLADYSLLAGTIKKKVLGFNKSVPLASATYDPSAQTVTLLPQGKRKLPKYEQLTIRSGLLTDSLGRPIDEGHTVVVTVGRSGQVISQAAVSTPPAPAAAMVDALFAGKSGFSARDSVERFGARRSLGRQGMAHG